VQPSQRRELDIGALASSVPENDGPIGETVYRLLRELIVSGELPGGTRLREQDLSERFQVSRTPVREALKRLLSEGLVASEPGRGIVVHSLSLDDVIDLYEIHEALQGRAARLAAQRLSEVDPLRLKTALEACGEALQAGDVEKAIEFDRRFESALRDAAHNEQLKRLIEQLHGSLARRATSDPVSPSRVAQRLAEHQRIVDAILSRDPDAAEVAARDHVRRAQDYRVAMIVREAP
jgi:DNA-binding GntR family transcriptional regulator